LGFTKDISSLLSVSDFLILPSLWEGLPLSLLEACLAGKAAIATDIPGSREVVRGGRTGLLVAARDAQALCRAIQSFLDDPEKVKKMGEEARGLARGFSFERMVTNYHDLYKKMIGGTRP